MNKKQIICMWCGIAVITLCSLDYLFGGDLYEYGLCEYLDIAGDFSDIVVLLFVIATITGGLIYTFKDKKPKDEQS